MSPSPSPSPSPTPTPDKDEFTSEITIAYDGTAFKGRVSSAKARCVEDRKVLLKKNRPARDPLVATDRAGATGRWRVAAPEASGRYYAVAVRAEVTTSSGRTVICRRAETEEQIRIIGA